MTPSDLCTACGLCCDGTLYSVAPLEPGDDAAGLEAMGVQVTQRKYLGFRLGCPLLKGTCCSIYEHRPAICGKFSCHVLSRFTRGEIAAADALALVRKAQRGRDRTKAAFAELVPDAHAMNLGELRAAAPTSDALRGDRALATRWGAALSQLTWLADLLRAEFRTEKEKGSNAPAPEAGST